MSFFKTRPFVWKLCLVAILAVSAERSQAACAPPSLFYSIRPCNWTCPDDKKGGAPLYSGPMNYQARCEPQVGKFANFYKGTVALAGRIEQVETIARETVLVFFPDAQSLKLLPGIRQSPELRFANDKAAKKLIDAPPTSALNRCWTAPVKISIDDLLIDRGNHDGNHDWVVLEKVIEIGQFKKYGCAFK